MYKAIIAVGIAAVACLVAGCGSSGDGTETAAVTKAQFIKQAEAICSEVQEEGRNARIAWERANRKEMDPDTAFKQIAGPTLQREATELRTLTVPEEDRAVLARMLENLSQGANAFASEGFNRKATSIFEAYLREAKAYGLEACTI